ncbi:hypothetical protein MNBD_GAMMA12-559 [hydrothermal vent metagenome]|uniref:Flagellar biosynthesis protein FlgE n=1 Tax=hydrothermal vent metagenome TaxID=652676 RepID=A0A3B0XXV0_9ZZZZ
MSGISALQNSVLGIQRGLQGAKKNAAEIASAAQFNANSPKDLAQSMVELKMNSLQVKASAKALQITSDTIGSIINIKA